MHPFTYVQASSIQDATSQAGGDAVFLGGGQTLLGAMRLRLAAHDKVIDIGRIDALRGIQAGADTVDIGAMTTHAAVAVDDTVRRRIPALAQLAGGIADRQVRNMATLGGSIAADDPSSCYPAGVLGLGATVVTDRRRIDADDFFLGLYETALRDGELIRQVSFPVPQSAGYIKFEQEASRYALVGVFVAQFADGVRVAVTGAGSAGVFRCAPLEQALSADFSADAARRITVSPDDLMSDIHAGADYRAHLIPVLAARAVSGAIAPTA